MVDKMVLRFGRGPRTRHVVVTTMPELLAPQVAAGLGDGVLVLPEAYDALEVLNDEQGGVCSLLVDVGPVGARWTGLRLLKHIRADRRLDALAFWLLAARPDDGLLRQWVGAAGAAGIAKRSARGVARAIDATLEGMHGNGRAQEHPGKESTTTGQTMQRVELARERAATDALMLRLGLQPSAWRQPDGTLRLEPLLTAIGASDLRVTPTR